MYLLQSYSEKDFTESSTVAAYWVFYKTVKSIMNNELIDFPHAVEIFFSKEICNFPPDNKTFVLKEKLIDHIESQLTSKGCWWHYYCPHMFVEIIESTITGNEILDKIAKLQEREG